MRAKSSKQRCPALWTAEFVNRTRIKFRYFEVAFKRVKKKCFGFRCIVAGVHVCLPVNGQRQPKILVWSAFFLWRWLFRARRNQHLLRSFHWFDFHMNLFEYWICSLSIEFAACLKPPSKDNHRKASYARTQHRDQGANWTLIMQSRSS